MIRGLLGKKIGMSQYFDKEGNIIPVTVIKTGPCVVLELKETPKKIKLAFEDVAESRLNKPDLGLFKKLGLTPKKYIREFESTDNSQYQVGQELKADFFRPGDFIDVSGTSIGKGFQGGMRRWGWHGGPAAHGSMHHRRIGSNGTGTWPGLTLRGKHMPGHMGNVRKTVQSLRVMQVDVENDLILVHGAVPGSKNALLEVRRSQKRAYKSFDEVKAIVKKNVNPLKQSKKLAKSGKGGKGGK
jgi:large subunit ribosomal protein L3